jgi:hypothetical protein
MDRVAELSVEGEIGLRFQLVAEIEGNSCQLERSQENDIAASTGNASHLRITVSGESAIAIEYCDHPGLDRVVSEFKTIAQAKLLKDVIKVSFNGALSYR